jgi:rhodanese-related sulfurtransferase
MTRISTAEAADLMSRGGYDLVDVREPHEWAGGHLPGARHVPLGTLARGARQHLPHDRVIFICGHGVRSLTAAAIAQSAGFVEVYSVDGGTAAWAAEGRPLAHDPSSGR